MTATTTTGVRRGRSEREREKPKRSGATSGGAAEATILGSCLALLSLSRSHFTQSLVALYARELSKDRRPRQEMMVQAQALSEHTARSVELSRR